MRTSRLGVGDELVAIIGVVLVTFGSCASALADGAPVIVWASGGHGLPVSDVDFSPDGSLAGSSSHDGTLKIWNVADGRMLHTVVPAVNSVTFSPDGNLVAGTGIGGASLWRVSDGSLFGDIFAIEDGSDSAFSADGELVAVSGSLSGFEESTIIYRLSTRTIERTMNVNDVPGAISVIFLTDNDTVVTGAASPFQTPQSAAIRFWSASSGAQLRAMNTGEERINALALRPDGLVFASAGTGVEIKIWDASDGSLLATIPTGGGEIYDLDYSPDGTRIATAHADGIIRIWDPAVPALVDRLSGHVGSVGGVAWSPTDDLIISGGGGRSTAGGDFTVRLWPAGGGPEVRRLTDRAAQVEGVAISADGSRVAVAAGTSALEIRRASDGMLLSAIASPDYATAAALSPDGAILATAGSSRRMRIYEADSGVLLHEGEEHSATVYAIAFSPTGEFVAVSDFDGPIQLVRVADGRTVRHLGNSGANALRFTPDGSMVVAASLNAALLLRVSDGGFVRFFGGHTAGVRDVDISPDGQMLATASIDRTARLWRLSDASLLHTLSGHQDWVRTVAFTPNGLGVVTGSSDTTLRVYRAVDGAFIRSIDRETGSAPRGLVATPSAALMLLGRRDGAVLAIDPPRVFEPGDVNCDTAVDALDIEPFILALFDPAGYEAGFPHCDRTLGDLNFDGQVDALDIEPFLNVLFP